jgi:hypothetical protein
MYIGGCQDRLLKNHLKNCFFLHLNPNIDPQQKWMHTLLGGGYLIRSNFQRVLQPDS